MKIRKKKTDKQIWVRYLDLLWRVIVHHRDNNTCQWCGKSGDIKLDAHHIFSRDDKATRWDTRNSALLCYYCHQHRLPKHPEDFRVFIITKIGLELYNQLYQKSHVILDTIPYEEIEQVLLREMLERNILVPKKPKKLN